MTLRLKLREDSENQAPTPELEPKVFENVRIHEGTLYQLLRRLESQGLLVSEWREEDKRNKRFYRLSPAGAETLQRLQTEWQSLNASMDRIL